MDQPPSAHSVSPSLPESSKDAAIRALGVLSKFIDPEAQAAILAKINRECAETADSARSAVMLGNSADVRPSRIITNWREVNEMMGGANRIFFGPDFLKNERGVVIPPAQIPKIYITEAEVVSAMRLGHTISLHSNIVGNGVPSTMLHIAQDELQRHGRNVLADIPLGNRQAFTSTADRLEWRQTSIGIVPGTSGLNYLQHMDVLVSYLKHEVVKGRSLFVNEHSAIREFEQHRAGLELLLIDWDKDHQTAKSRDGKPVLNWNVAADIMADLEITKLVRPTTVGLLNDIVNAQIVGTPMLTRDFTATADRYSFGSFVALGPVSARGACLDCWNPIATSNNYGAIFSYNRTGELSS